MICRRIAQVRLRLCGPRGKSRFAKMLDIAPSTYEYYERHRVPPAPLLAKISDLAGVSLRWLITGEEPEDGAISGGHPVVRRAAHLLAEHPNAANALGAFLDLLEGSLAFPPKDHQAGRTTDAGDDAPPRAVAASPPAAEADESPDEDTPDPDRPDDADDDTGAPRRTPLPQTTAEQWLPVLGRSAAGVPRFWSETGGPPAETSLRDLIGRHVPARSKRVEPAVVESAETGQAPVGLITLARPEPGAPSEFLSAPTMKQRWPDAFAVRIDGDSMAPDILHGDLVILSPSAPAREGEPAVVQLRDQIGVTCKIYRREADRVHLVSRNESVPPTRVPADDVEWALRVIGRVRL
jgi:phage repressor protein C with HTH and peptisase S24 domain